MSSTTSVSQIGEAHGAFRLSDLGTIEEWLDVRRQGIGGSDAGAIMGVDSYRGPYAVWLSKTHDLDVKINSFDHPTQWGHRLEGLVAEAYSEKNGRRIFGLDCILRSRTHSWQMGNLDRAFDTSKGLMPLECKVTGSRWWDGDIPDKWRMQVLHYLSVTELPYGDLAILVQGNRYEQHRVSRDEGLLAELVARESNLWNSVLTRTPPVHDGSPDAHRLLASAKPHGRTQLTEEQFRLLLDYEAAKKIRKDSEADERALRNEVERAVGLASDVYYRDVKVATWKGFKRSRIDPDKLKAKYPDIADDVTNTNPYRQLRVKASALSTAQREYNVVVHDPADVE